MEEKDLSQSKFFFERNVKIKPLLLCAIKLVFVSSLRLDILSGSLSLLCAIKFVFASSRGWT